MTDLEKICADAYEARVKIGTLDTDIKNKVLNDAADNLLKAEKEILEANKKGCDHSRGKYEGKEHD